MKTKMNIKSIIILALLCMASMFFINICFAANSNNSGKITTETAKLREQPNTDSKVLELVSNGDNVEIIEEKDGWYKVKYNQITGYIRNDLVEVEKTTNQNDVKQEENKVEQQETVTESKEETNTLEIKLNEKYKIKSNSKLKIIPLITSIEMYDVNENDQVEVIEILNDWVKVKTSNESQGWIIKEKLKVIEEEVKTVEQPAQTTVEEKKSTTKTMYINVELANIRKEANKTSELVKQLPLNTSVNVIETTNGWSKIEVDGVSGYISENLLSSTKQETSRSAMTSARTTDNEKEQVTTETKTETQAQTKSNASTSTETKSETTVTSKTGASVVEYAKQFIGCPYVYGGTSTKGFDCSGFTQYVYKHFGVNLNRTAAAQYSNGVAVTELQAGDLVMFGKSGINHVGIYVGGNTFVHAANKTRGVTTDTLASGYYKTNYVGARRIF